MSPTIVTTDGRKKSPLRQLPSTNTAIPSPSASTSQIDAAQKLRKLDVVEFDALRVAGDVQHLESANFQPLDLGITIPSFLRRYRNSTRQCEPWDIYITFSIWDAVWE